MIPPAQQWCIQIDVTNACPRKCSNCTRSLAHAREPFYMRPAAFRDACRALADFPARSPPDAQGRHKVVGMIGGEPLAHPDFATLCAIMSQEIRDRNRRGLWTAVDWEEPRKRPRISTDETRIEEKPISIRVDPCPSVAPFSCSDLIRRTFGYVNENRHAPDAPSAHQPVLVAIQDVIADPVERQRLIDACWVQRIWSGTITPRGFYFCEVAAALAGIFDGPPGLPVEPGCWRRDLADFQYQIDWACRRCGCALPLPGRLDAEQRDDVSPLNLHALVNVRSPGLERLELFVAASYAPPANWQPNRYQTGAVRPWRKISSQQSAASSQEPGARGQESGARSQEPAASVSLTADCWPLTAANAATFSWSDVRAVVVCVDYADILAMTLPRMLAHFGEVLVVSSPADTATGNVVAANPWARLYTTDAFQRDGASFNKGLAIEEAFGLLGRSGWLAVVDADIVFPAQLPAVSPVAGKLYSAHRRICPSVDRIPPESAWVDHPRHKEVEHAGYFQLFHADDPVLAGWPWYGVNWLHAGGCDAEFQALWAKGDRQRFDFDVLHLGPIDTNWYGRHLADAPEKMRGQWKLRRWFGTFYEYIDGSVAAFRSRVADLPEESKKRFARCLRCSSFLSTWCKETPGPGSGADRLLHRLEHGECVKWPSTATI